MTVTRNKILLGLALALCVSVLTATGIFLRVSLQKRRIHQSTMVLYRSLTSGNMTPEHKAPIEESFNKYVNKKLDLEPVMMLALAGREGGDPHLTFWFYFSDEDRDIEGIGITETRFLSKDQLVEFEERYPIFHFHKSSVLSISLARLKLRESGERKDEQFWDNFLKTGKPAFGETEPPEEPKILMSMPEPNKVDVKFWVYDKAGHRSNSVGIYNPQHLWKLISDSNIPFSETDP